MDIMHKCVITEVNPCVNSLIHQDGFVEGIYIIKSIHNEAEQIR